jgi:hypothetical protein
MFNNGLKYTVSNICGELSAQLAQSQMFPPAPQPLQANAPSMSSDEVFSLIEKLADLHAKGILSDADYEAKKAALLARL